MNMQSCWQPDASIEALRFRAAIMQKIRQFFADRDVLEIETPLLGLSTATDPHLTSFITESSLFPSAPLFLQTSPEFPMKRLLAAGSGPIFQICKAFRNGEVSKRHNPEFTILEWYRPGFDHHQLMDEMDELLMHILHTAKAQRISYQQLFKNFLNIDVSSSNESLLLNCLEQHAVKIAEEIKLLNFDNLLDLLLTHLIEPQLGLEQPVFIYDYPASQAALARIRTENFAVGERFEVYYRGLELANGYHELSDAIEQRQRFVTDNDSRRQLCLDQIPLDEKFLASLTSFPQCAGVALGIDRLVMLAFQTDRIHDVLSFSFDRL